MYSSSAMALMCGRFVAPKIRDTLVARFFTAVVQWPRTSFRFKCRDRATQARVGRWWIMVEAMTDVGARRAHHQPYIDSQFRLANP